MSGNNEDTFPNLAAFQLGELPQGSIAVLLGYAAGQRPSGHVLESFVIGMSRDQARLFADALVRLADEPLSGGVRRSDVIESSMRGSTLPREPLTLSSLSTFRSRPLPQGARAQILALRSRLQTF